MFFINIIKFEYFNTSYISEDNLSTMFDECKKLNIYINPSKYSNLISIIPNYVNLHNITQNKKLKWGINGKIFLFKNDNFKFNDRNIFK